MKDLAQWVQHAYTLAEKAGQEIMRIYQQDQPIIPQYKKDKSPLTIADQASHDIIVAGLSQYELAGSVAPVVSEEGEMIPFVERQGYPYYWCVDPLDGTKDFIARSDEFTVNIALIADHVPLLGVVYVPAQKLGYLAWKGGGAFRCVNGQQQTIQTQQPSPKPLRVIVSRQYQLDTVQPWLSKLGQTELIQQGSALKFCTIAAGEADLFLRLSPTSEWDNAAGQCILEEAGGHVYTFNQAPLRYNCSGTFEQAKFIAVGSQSSEWTKLFSR